MTTCPYLRDREMTSEMTSHRVTCHQVFSGCELSPFCFWSGVAEAGWAGRRQEMSLVEELLVKESSPLSASSGLSESGGGASSVL